MNKKMPGGRIRVILSMLGLCLLVGVVLTFSEQVSSREFLPLEQMSTQRCSVGESTPALPLMGPVIPARADAADTGTLEKMIVAKGNVTMDVDVSLLSGSARSRRNSLRFAVEPDSFFKILVFNGEYRGSMPSAMNLIPQNAATLPARLAAGQLTVESLSWGGQYSLVIRDGKTGLVYFNIEGYEYSYDPDFRTLGIINGRLLVSNEFAAELGNPSAGGTIVGQISIAADMRAIEVTQIAGGQVESNVLPAGAGASPESGSVPGPDVVVGDLSGLAQFGASGGQVGLAVGTDSCNFGTVPLNWFANPANDHPVIPQNLYRMSGGTTNDERFEQIGQSQVKHAFTALQNNICSLGCSSTASTWLGSGCSDPYDASLNATPNLGARAWINPFTGVYPRNDSATPNNSHSGHTHASGAALHRMLVNIGDLNTSANPGATYYTEAQYVTPHEYAHCQANPGQCNQYNNASYRRYNVTGTASPFSFSPVGSTVRQKAAVVAWTGATMVEIKPAPGVDGIGAVAYKVTNPSAGVWRYEYAVLNQNLDRAIQSFSIPTGNGVTLTNTGFHAPPQHPGYSGDGTLANAGFSSTAWAESQAGGAMTWSSETFAQNQNANAIRWGTLYNFRFDSNRPPQATNATVGFFKTGSPITVAVQGPTPVVSSNVSVSGRVTANGFGLRNAIVTISDVGGGNPRHAYTSSFGYYRFDNVASGASYTVSVGSKRYTFMPQTLPVNDNLSNVDFAAAIP